MNCRSKMSAMTATVPLLALGLAVALNGCTGYQLGTSLPPGIRSVAVPVFANKTNKSDLPIQATNATIQELQRDGTLRLAPADQADTILDVTATGYQLAPIRYANDRRTTASEYRMTLTTHVVFRNRTTGAVLLQATVVSDATTFPMTGDLTSAERSALPLASQDLARKIVERMLETW